MSFKLRNLEEEEGSQDSRNQGNLQSSAATGAYKTLGALSEAMYEWCAVAGERRPGGAACKSYRELHSWSLLESSPKPEWAVVETQLSLSHVSSHDTFPHASISNLHAHTGSLNSTEVERFLWPVVCALHKVTRCLLCLSRKSYAWSSPLPEFFWMGGK